MLCSAAVLLSALNALEASMRSNNNNNNNNNNNDKYIYIANADFE